MKILAIDPGNKESAYCEIDVETRKPGDFAKAPNEAVLELLLDANKFENFSGSRVYEAVVIERVASYGMPVGREVFEACEWIGRFQQAVYGDIPVEFVYRMDEKVTICHDSRAKDANIRQALIDRFAERDLKNGKGTKANPDFFYGFAADVWAAYAVGTTWLDRRENENEHA